MSSIGALTGILRTQTTAELDCINRELCDNRVTNPGLKEDYIKRLRRSLKNSLEKDKMSWGEFVAVLHMDNEAHTSTKIRHQIEDMELSKTARYKKGGEALEHYVTAEVFQALHWKFEGEGVTVQDEEYHNKSVNRPDITVVDGPNTYIIEIKTSSLGAMDTLKDQVKKYRGVDGFQRLFVVYVTHKNWMTLDQNDKRKRMIGGLKGHYDRFEVIEKTPSDFST